MKKFFVYLMAVVAMAVCSVSAFAQNTLVATSPMGTKLVCSMAQMLYSKPVVLPHMVT